MDTLLLAAAALACPIGMGAMMVMMMRGQRRGEPTSPEQREVNRLQAEIDQLEADRAASHISGRL